MPPKAKKDEPDQHDGGAATTEPLVEKGVFTFPDSGCRYEGDFIEVREPTAEAADPIRQRHGLGVHEGGGERYEGEWRHDQLDGHGRFTFADGTAYVGSFRAGRYHGTGHLTWPDQSAYDGDWVDGRMHGAGVYIDAGGNAWRGRFCNDCYENDSGVWIPVKQPMP